MFRRVLERNSFYFFNAKFEESYEAHIINVLKTLLLNLKNSVEVEGCKHSVFVDFVMSHEFGLDALLVLNGVSSENLKRIYTLARVVKERSLVQLLQIDEWLESGDASDITEWSDAKFRSFLSCEKFVKGLLNLFFHGSSNLFLAKTLPLFELSKLNLQKINFDTVALIDTLIRYKQKGSYIAQKENNPECLIEEILISLGVCFERGDLPLLLQNSTKRTMDFIIPNKNAPKIIIESSFLTTTSSGQGDKAKSEIGVSRLLKQHYPNAKFIGFVDGIGWYVRQRDLARLVEAFDDVYTFRGDELARFVDFVKMELQNG